MRNYIKNHLISLSLATGVFLAPFIVIVSREVRGEIRPGGEILFVLLPFILAFTWDTWQLQKNVPLLR